MPLTVHTKLAPAVSSAKEKRARVFARDRLFFAPGTDVRPGVKQYVVGTAQELYHRLRTASKTEHCYYEVLDSDHPSRFYVDIEFRRPSIEGLDLAIATRNIEAYFRGANPGIVRVLDSFRSTSNQPFHPAFASKVLDRIVRMMAIFFERRLNVLGIDRDSCTILSASTSAKLSFHIILPVLMDTHIQSTAALVYELAVQVRDYAIKKIAEASTVPDWDPDEMAVSSDLLLLQLSGQGRGSFAFDLVPYGRNQLYRLAGNTKGGQCHPLRPIDRDNTDIISDEGRTFKFATAYPDFGTWYRTLTQAEGALAQLNTRYLSFTVTFSPTYPWADKGRRAKENVQRAACDLLGRLEGTPMDAATQKVQEATRKRIQEQAVGSAVQSRSVRRVDIDQKSHLLEDTAAIVLDDSVTRENSIFSPLGRRFSAPAVKQKILGGSSVELAHVVFESRAGDRALHCFGCEFTLFAATTFTRDRMETTEEERIKFTDPETRINEGARVDVVLRPDIRIFALSAETGLGKSTFVRTYLAANPLLKVCAPSYRESIAINQAITWGLYSYKDPNAYNDNNASRISVCINSLKKIPEHIAYDIVIMDEVDAIRSCLGDSTNNRYTEVYQRLVRLLRNCSVVILMQADLTEDVVRCVADICRVDAEDRQFVQRCQIETPRMHYPMARSDKFDGV